MFETPARRRYLGAAAYVALFALGEYVVLPAGDVTGDWEHWWADVAWTLAALLAAAESLRAARRCQGAQRRAWTFFALGCLSWFAGMVVWDVHELFFGQVTPFPAFSDIGFLALAPLFVLGLIYKHTHKPRGTVTLKNIADLGVIVSGVTAACLIALAEPMSDPTLSGLYVGTALAYPVLYISAFVFSFLALLRHGAWGGRGVLPMILASLGIHAITDTVYAYSLLTQSYGVGHYLDVFWIIAFALTYSAAVAQGQLQAAGLELIPGVPPLSARTRRFDTLVFVGILLAAGVTAFWYSGRLDVTTWRYLSALFIALALFLGLREWANHRMQMLLTGEVQASERDLARILSALDDAYFRTNVEGRIEKVSGAVERILGYRRDELMGTRIADLYVDPDGRERFIEALAANGGVLHDYEAQLRRRDGSVVWVSTNSHHVKDVEGRVTGVEGTTRDITDRKRTEAEMDKLSSALRQTADAVMITDPGGIIEYVNPAFEASTGFTRDETIGARPSILKSGKHDAEFYSRLWSTILEGKAFSDIFINRRKDHSFFYEAKTITPLIGRDGQITHFVSTGKDITEQMQAQERLQFMAHHDVLTELPNRTLFLDRVNQALARTRWHTRLAAVLFLDIDQFKYINDSLGHDVGDKLLVEIADRLRSQLRPGDTVARFGGDEFVILLDDIATYDDITHIAEKVLQALRPPISIDRMELHVTATVGISVCPNDGEDAQTLLKNADSAMYRAKEAGRDTYHYYSDDMSTRAFERLTLENSLRRALERDEFELYYQPQIDVVAGRVVGVEALLRWNHPEVGVVPPDEFVPLLEETGLIVPVGAWVLETACRQRRTWAWNGQALALAVNISARQFSDTGFLQTVERIARACGGSRQVQLELEMTESIFLRQTQATSQTLAALDRMGIRLAIDDFGTGYSALNYLKRFPIGTLKIDRSFVRDIMEDANDAELTAAILAMAQRLGLRVVAEGVETPQQLEFLRAQGCRYVQGFLFGQPCPAEQISTLLGQSDFPPPLHGTSA